MSTIGHENVHPDYHLEIASRFEEGDHISIMLLGLEMGQKLTQVPGGVAPMQAPVFYQAIFKAATQVGLICDLEQKVQEGTQLITDIVIQWQYIRLLGKTGEVSTIARPKIKL